MNMLDLLDPITKDNWRYRATVSGADDFLAQTGTCMTDFMQYNLSKFTTNYVPYETGGIENKAIEEAMDRAESQGIDALIADAAAAGCALIIRLQRDRQTIQLPSTATQLVHYRVNVQLSGQGLIYRHNRKGDAR